MKSNLLKIILILAFTIFVASYFIEETGYYDYKLQEKMILTNEQIKKFEQDIKGGKEVDIESYLKEQENINEDVLKKAEAIEKFLKELQRKYEFINKEK